MNEEREEKWEEFVAGLQGSGWVKKYNDLYPSGYETYLVKGKMSVMVQRVIGRSPYMMPITKIKNEIKILENGILNSKEGIIFTTNMDELNRIIQDDIESWDEIDGIDEEYPEWSYYSSPSMKIYYRQDVQ